MGPVAIDTNVPMTANGEAEQASLDCIQQCMDRLTNIRGRQLILLDNLGLILAEYRTNLSPRGEPGVGDAFFKWVWDNQANPTMCQQVALTRLNGEDDFEEFPKDPKLARFDRSDRKFVAVVLSSGEPAPIINATDTDWWIHRRALEAHGIKIEFLCPELMHEQREGR